MSTDPHGEGRPNWVKERAECTSCFAFERLCKEMRDDLEAMKPYPSIVVYDCKDVTVEQEHNVFRVYCDSLGSGKPVALIRVNLRPDKICIWRRDADRGQVETHLRPEWNAGQNCCQLLYNDEDIPLAYWEVSKRVLEPLFFG